jgi:hypothetical protein
MSKLTEQNIAKILVKAKNYIKRHGWTQMDYGWKASGPACMIGACNAVTTKDSPGDDLSKDTPETKIIRKFLREKFKINSVEGWNDDKVKSRKEVFNLIDRAVAKLTK